LFCWAVLVVGAVVVAGTAPALGGTTLVPPGGSYYFIETWPGGDEGSGKLENLTGVGLQVTATLAPIDASPPVVPGFELIDTTKLELILDPDVRTRGRLKVVVRKKATAAIRRAARLKGYREKDLVLMVRERREEAGLRRARYRPCARLMRLRGYPPRRKKEEVALDSAEWGEWGYDPDTGYVWGVTDVGGSYAIGVPEPATAACVLAGGAVLAVARMRRRR